MSTLSEWSDAIRISGELQREKDQKTREELLAQPHKIVEEKGTSYAIWRGINCISIATFHNHMDGTVGPLDLHSFHQLSDEFITALVDVKENGEICKSKN